MQLVEVGVCLCLLVVSVRPLAGLPEYRELIPGTPTVNGKRATVVMLGASVLLKQTRRFA